MWSAWRVAYLAITMLAFCLGAAAEPVAPINWPQAVSADMLAAGEVGAGVIDYNMTFQGRELNLLQGTLDAGLTDEFSLGGRYCLSSGHGRSKSNTYSDHGKDIWGKYQLFAGCGGIQSLALYAEYTSDNASLRTDSTTQNANADISTTSTGVQLLASTGIRRSGVRWHARTGAYRTEVLGDPLSTTYLAGGDVLLPLSQRMNVQAAVTGYTDDFDGGSTTAELLLALSYCPGHSKITLSGGLYPKGVPLASTPFSPAAAVGTFFVESATSSIRTESMGYVSLSCEFLF